MADVDLANRDPNDINSHVRASFEDVLAEPDGLHSVDCVWTFAFSCFNCSRSCCYNFLSIFLGIPMALCWGCEFALITFGHVWTVTPCLRVCTINCGSAQMYFGTCVQCIMGPICDTCALAFSKIMVKNVG